MAIVDESGFTPQRFQDFVNILTTVFQTALGRDLALEAETEQAELIAVLAEVLAAADAQLEQVASGNNPQTAPGRFLDDLVSWLGIVRVDATHSTVTATVSGAEATTLPVGSQARTTGGDLFATTAEAVIPASGSIDVAFRAVEAGPVGIGATTLTEVVSGVLGWDSVTNANAGTVGRPRETDAALRDRYAAILDRNNLSTAEALRARVLSLEGVNGCPRP